MCDIQRVPAGRCSFGNLAPGLNSCVWPHRAGRCNGNIKVGCLTGGPTGQCSGLVPDTCDLTIDKYGRPADPNDAATCTCQGTNAAAADFELTVCGAALSICSDGDPDRVDGGRGVALGVQLNLSGPGLATFASMGPSITGSALPTASPGYGLENPPQNFDPQRDAGSVGRTPTQGTGIIRQARTTDAREILPYAHPTIANPPGAPLNVRKIKSFGDSYWGDWFFISAVVAPPLNAHIVTYTCDPPQGWVVGTPVNSGPNGIPNDFDDPYCHQAARNGLSFLWEDNLTVAQKAAYTVGGVPVCPPHCYFDYDISTQETAEFGEVGTADPNAGIQLAIQSGEPDLNRVAGARDAIGVAAVTSLTFLTDLDLRCRLGGWGSPAGEIGRCIDGPRSCVPGSAGDVACGLPPDQDGVVGTAVQGGSCRPCNGPITGPNPLGLPIGYNTYTRPELALVANQRIGGIGGQNADVRIVLFVVGTTGNAASDFRDIAGEGSPPVDEGNMGPVDSGLPFAPGIGAGGTFTGGVDLNIDEACCGTSGLANVTWDPAALGTVVSGSENGFSYRYGAGVGDIFLSDWSLVYDRGPGPDGIPGCIGDNLALSNGGAACNTRLGFGPIGAKTNAFFATGQDDRINLVQMGAVTKPGAAPKYKWRDAEPAVMAYFGNPVQNPPTTNSIAAFTLRDLTIFSARAGDVLVKVNTTQCPLTNTGPVCTGAVVAPPCEFDADGDSICDPVDNCVNVSNLDQANADADLFGDVCDNCSAIANNDQADGDADARGNVCDNCPTVANGLAQAAVANVGNQIDGTTAWTVGQVLESTLAAGPTGGGAPGVGDGVGDACDSCPRARNPRVVPAIAVSEAAFFTANQWATLTGGQRDDDHDGFGNKCDGDFTATGALTGTADLTQWRSANGKSRTSLTLCGSPAGQRCARYDLDEAGGLVGTGDLTAWRLENGSGAGPKCPTCPLACTSGTSVTCSSPP